MATPLSTPVSSRLLLIWTAARCRRAPEDALRRALEGGIDVVQVREKTMPAPALLLAVRRALAIAAPYGVPVMVNDRADVALAGGAHGVQLGLDDLPPGDARRLLPPPAWIGVSTHSLAQVDAARAAGADLVGFGPMFATATKPLEPAIGPGDLDAADERAGVPLFAIGGLDAARIEAIGARRAAVSSAILSADDPAEAARSIRAALEQRPLRPLALRG